MGSWKQLAGYFTKQNAEALTAKTNVRRRPLRTSRGWGGGMNLGFASRLMTDGMDGGGREGAGRGPFAFVQVLANGDVMVRVGEDWQRFDAPRPPVGEHAPTTTDDDGATPSGGATEEEEGRGVAQPGGAGRSRPGGGGRTRPLPPPRYAAAGYERVGFGS